MEGIGGDELDDVNTRKFNVIEKKGNNYGFYFTVNYNTTRDISRVLV